MGANIKPIEPRDMSVSLEGAEVEREPSHRTVPEKPTLDMLAAGSSAGGVPVETVWNIWRAMLKAAPR